MRVAGMRRGWRRALAGCALALLLPSLAASAPPRAAGVAFDRGAVSIGDTVSMLHRVAGRPDRVVAMPARDGGPAYERHEYFFEGRTVIVTARDGRITGLADNRIVQRP